MKGKVAGSQEVLEMNRFLVSCFAQPLEGSGATVQDETLRSEHGQDQVTSGH